MRGIGEGVVRIAVLVVAGAIIYDVLTHPKGTKTVFSGVSTLWSSSLSAASGRNIK